MPISDKIVLGTAQFGLHYGITNIRGKPAKRDVLSILDLAWENGVRCFDTAPSYGSEKLIGEFVENNGIQDKVKILTKIPSLESKDYRDFIRLKLDASVNYLRCPINVLFFHNPEDSVLLIKDPEFFKGIKEDYSISEFGVSIYDPQEIEFLSDSPYELAFQFPFNVLDRRFKQVNMHEGMRYARSIFLQGILASRCKLDKKAPKPLLELQMNYHSFLNKREINPLKYALSFAYFADNVDYFLIGVDTSQQLNEILNIEIDTLKHFEDFDSFSFEYDSKWLDPRKWD